MHLFAEKFLDALIDETNLERGKNSFKRSAWKLLLVVTYKEIIMNYKELSYKESLVFMDTYHETSN